VQQNNRKTTITTKIVASTNLHILASFKLTLVLSNKSKIANLSTEIFQESMSKEIA